MSGRMPTLALMAWVQIIAIGCGTAVAGDNSNADATANVLLDECETWL